MSRAPRIDCSGVARIVAPGASWTGRCVNLSSSGAFIAGTPLLNPGRRVSMDLDLGDDQPPVAVHAKVVWTRPWEDERVPSGFGVRFVRVDDEAARRIAQRIEDAAHPRHEIHHEQVRVQLAGTAARLRASAREIGSMLILESEIPWLGLGRDVAVELAEGDVRQGRLAWFTVDAAPSGHARLHLTVDLEVEEEIERIYEIEAEPEEPIAATDCAQPVR